MAAGLVVVENVVTICKRAADRLNVSMFPFFHFPSWYHFWRDQNHMLRLECSTSKHFCERDLFFLRKKGDFIYSWVPCTIPFVLNKKKAPKMSVGSSFIKKVFTSSLLHLNTHHKDVKADCKRTFVAIVGNTTMKYLHWDSSKGINISSVYKFFLMPEESWGTQGAVDP